MRRSFNALPIRVLVLSRHLWRGSTLLPEKQHNIVTNQHRCRFGGGARTIANHPLSTPMLLYTVMLSVMTGMWVGMSYHASVAGRLRFPITPTVLAVRRRERTVKVSSWCTARCRGVMTLIRTSNASSARCAAEPSLQGRTRRTVHHPAILPCSQDGKADLLQFIHVASKQACEMVITTIKAPCFNLAM